MPIGTMPTGWTQVKMTLNFTSDTYTFSTRPDTSTNTLSGLSDGAVSTSARSAT